MTHLRRGGDLVGLGAPEAYLSVTRSADHPVAVGTEPDAADALGRFTARACEWPPALDRRAGASVEETRGPVTARRRHRGTVGPVRDLPDVVAVVDVDRSEPGLAGPRAPRRELTAAIAGDDRLAVRAVRHAQEIHRASHEREPDRAAGSDVVLRDDALLGGHGQPGAVRAERGIPRHVEVVERDAVAG